MIPFMNNIVVINYFAWLAYIWVEETNYKCKNIEISAQIMEGS